MAVVVSHFYTDPFVGHFTKKVPGGGLTRPLVPGSMKCVFRLWLFINQQKSTTNIYKLQTARKTINLWELGRQCEAKQASPTKAFVSGG